MPKITYGIDKITTDEIKKILVKCYSGHNLKSIQNNMTRPLIRTDCNNNYGNVGTILFSLEGSPPKGYALVICELRQIHFYDAWGRPFKSMGNVTLV
jgi:hypothetical protein